MAKFEDQLKKVPKGNKVFQLGDFGFRHEHEWLKANHPNFGYVVFGNHDYIPMVEEPYSIGHFRYFPEIGVFAVRGANSIDRWVRRQGFDWFPDEELSYTEMQAAIDLYEQVKPRIVLSHDCPQSIARDEFKIRDGSLTRHGLERMFEIHQPEFWAFGHHHRELQVYEQNTMFICGPEAELFNFDNYL